MSILGWNQLLLLPFSLLLFVRGSFAPKLNDGSHWFLEKGSYASEPPRFEPRSGDALCDLPSVLHVVAMSNNAKVSLSLFSCWVSWIGEMIKNDPKQAYRLHLDMSPDSGQSVGRFHNKGSEKFLGAQYLEGSMAGIRRMHELLHTQDSNGSYVIRECDAAIFSDVDVLPLRPYSTLLALPPVDVRFFIEPVRTWHSVHGIINSGFYLMRNRPATRRLLSRVLFYIDTYAREWKKRKKLFGIGNQLLFNRALFSSDSAGLRWGGFAVYRSDITGTLMPFDVKSRPPRGAQITFLVGRAGPLFNSYLYGRHVYNSSLHGSIFPSQVSMISNVTVAYHACCTADKWERLNVASKCFGRWQHACLSPPDTQSCGANPQSSTSSLGKIL
jgi:hypothetical protein